MSETPKLLPADIRDAIIEREKEPGTSWGFTKHIADCTIYASLYNQTPTDGICTCGYGRRWGFEHGVSDKMFSAEREAAMRADSALAARHERLRSAVALALPALRRCAMHLQGRPQFREDENILSYRIGELRDALEADR